MSQRKRVSVTPTFVIKIKFTEQGIANILGTTPRANAFNPKRKKTGVTSSTRLGSKFRSNLVTVLPLTLVLISAYQTSGERPARGDSPQFRGPSRDLTSVKQRLLDQ